MAFSNDSTQIRVAAVQMHAGEDKAANIATALTMIDDAAGTGARLVVLPEIWTFLGPSSGQRAAAETVPGELTDRLADRARRHGIYLHAGSILEQVSGEPRLFNTAVVFNPDGDIIATYRKIHLFDVDIAGKVTAKESDNIRPGHELVTANIEGHIFGLAICYDLRFPELFRSLALMGAEAIFLPSAFTLQTGRDHWDVLIRARAIENACYMLAPGLVGKHENGGETYGHSMIVDPWGTIVGCMPDEVGVVISELDFDRQARIRAEIPVLANRQPAAYSRLLVEETVAV